MKKIKLLLTFIALLIIFFFGRECVVKIDEYYKIQKYGEPISEDGTINNEYFAIDLNEQNAEKITEGINKAIEYANKNSIKYLKLEKGVYLIDGVSNIVNANETDTKKGIILKSNLTFDLNGATLKQIANDKVNYAIISITDVENVKLINGKIEGDKNEHDYSKESTHEWGFGVDIRGSERIEIENLEISDCTGDGIIATDYKNRIKSSKDIRIKNTTIHDCRRNGISIISAIGVEISENEIYHINGTAPQSAIILESWDSKQIIDEVNICNNKIYQNGIGIDIQTQAQNVNIYENDCSNNILVLNSYGICKIYDNEINDAELQVSVEKEAYEQGRRINKAIVENNKLANTSLYILNVENIAIINNEILNSNISIYSSNCLVDKNKLENKNEMLYWGLRYYVSEFKKEKYDIYIGNNTYKGNYNTNESIMESERIELHKENIYDYYNAIFK